MPEALYVVFCILVIVLVFFLAWLVPRLLASRSGMTGGGRHIAVLEKVAVSKDVGILLVRAFGKLMVVGMTPHGMEKLLETEDTLPPEQLFGSSGEGFSEILKKSLNSALPDGKVKNAVSRLFEGKGGGGDDKT